jgi:hypothetical protein
MKRLFIINLLILTGALASTGQPQVSKRGSIVTANDGVSIAYETHGTGPAAIVFVDGWSCDRSYWKHQILPFHKRTKRL